MTQHAWSSSVRPSWFTWCFFKSWHKSRIGGNNLLTALVASFTSRMLVMVEYLNLRQVNALFLTRTMIPRPGLPRILRSDFGSKLQQLLVFRLIHWRWWTQAFLLFVDELDQSTDALLTRAAKLQASQEGSQALASEQQDPSSVKVLMKSTYLSSHCRANDTSFSFTGCAPWSKKTQWLQRSTFAIQAASRSNSRQTLNSHVCSAREAACARPIFLQKPPCSFTLTCSLQGYMLQ